MEVRVQVEYRVQQEQAVQTEAQAQAVQTEAQEQAVRMVQAVHQEQVE